MAGELETTTLIPRFSSFLAAGTYTTGGLNVTDFAGATVHVWRGPLIGTSPTVSFTFEESIDQESWTTCVGDAGGDPGASAEGVYTITFKKRWFRVKVTLGGTGAGPGVTCWAVAGLERRES
jgi:hypothetical protein